MLVKAVKVKTLSNYGTSMLQFTQFCDTFNIPKDLQSVVEWLLSHFITAWGASSVGGGTMRTWLLGLELWHVVNAAPWQGSAHLRRVTQCL